MARPIKKGLSYFPLDVRAFDDPKLVSLVYQHGPLGGFIYIRALCLVYDNGYYLELTEDELAIKLHIVMGSKWMNMKKIREMIQACVHLGLFDKAMYTQGVITSVSIQKQFILSTKRRKNIDIDKYWLLDSATMDKLGVLLSMQKNAEETTETGVNVDNNSVNVNKSTQSKRKSKRDKKKIKEDKSIYGSPKMHYLTKLIVNRKYICEVDENILKYNGMFESAIIEYGYDNVLIGVNYLISYSKHPGVPIDDKYSFMKSSLLSNLDRFRRQEKGANSFEDWIKSIF